MALARLIRTYAWWVLRWRWAVLLAMMALTALAASGARFLNFSTDYRIYFSKSNPHLQAFEALQNIYTKNDDILFVVAPDDRDVFTGRTLDAIEHLTRKAWQIPYAIRVDSVTNFQHIRADGDTLIVTDLITEARQNPPARWAEAKRIALSEPHLLNRLISPAAHVTGVHVILQLPGQDETEAPKAASYARQLAQEMEASHPHLDIYVTGGVMLNHAFFEAGVRDMKTLTPLMYVGMFLLIIWFLRSLSGLVVTVVVIGFSTAIALGFAGWLGVGLTPPSAQAPTIIMTLAIADSLHLLSTMFETMRRGVRKFDAIVASLEMNLKPVFLTSATTAVGFLSLNFSDAPPFRHLGNLTAIGVIAAFILSILFLPAFMGVFPTVLRARGRTTRFRMYRFSEWVIRRRRGILWGSVPLIIGVACGVPLNDLDGNFVDYFDPRIRFRTDTDFAMQHLTGINEIQHSLSASGQGGISDQQFSF